MYYQLANKLVLPVGAQQVSRAVAMGNGNQVRFQIETIAVTEGNIPELTVTLQGSNDVQNWIDIKSVVVDAVGYTPEQTIVGVANEFVRLKYDNTGASFVISASLVTVRL